MPNVIFLKIDVTKIDNARLFAGKNGAKYLDLVCVPSQNSKYGDSHFITQSCSKEERLAGLKMPIIGNAKEQTSTRRDDSTPFDSQKPANQSAKPTEQAPDEDVPF